MTRYNSLNVKVSDSQLNKLKLIKNETEVVLRLSSNMVGNSNDDTNFSHKLLLPNKQVGMLRNVFANKSSTDIVLWKTQLFKTIQSGEFLGKLLSPLSKTALPLMKNVMKPLVKNVLTTLGLKAAVSARDAGIHKKS